MDTSLKEEQRLLKKAQRKLRMEQSRSYRAMKTATKVMDGREIGRASCRERV